MATKHIFLIRLQNILIIVVVSQIFNRDIMPIKEHNSVVTIAKFLIKLFLIVCQFLSFLFV